MQTGRKRTAGIDGLRAIAMTMVIAQHAGLLPFGWTGVWLFYVISGYVIALGFEEDARGEVAASAGSRWIEFWKRRAIRLLPAFALYLVACGAVLLAAGLGAPWRDLPWLVLFAQNWHMIFDFGGRFSGWPPFGHLWTLSVEQQFYLFFPLLALGLDAGRRVRVTLLLVALGPVCRALWSAWLARRGMAPGAVAFGVYAASHVQVDAFLMGTLLARAQATGRLAGAAGRAWSRTLWRAAAAAAAGYALVFVAINVAWRDAHGLAALHDVFSGVLSGQGRETWVYSVVSLAATALVLHVMTHRADRFCKAMRWAPWAWVGRVSYAGYLFHLLVLWLAGEMAGAKVRELPLVPRVGMFMAVWVATLAAAAISRRLVEAPAAAWFRKARGSTGRPAARGAEAMT